MVNVTLVEELIVEVLIDTGDMVIVVPFLLVTLQSEANTLPEAVTTSPTDIPSLFGLTTKVLAPIAIDEVVLAYENRVVGLHAKINLKHKDSWFKDTTVGRAIFNSILPVEMDYVDGLIDKKLLTTIVNQCYLVVGNYKTVIFLDALKDLGFKMATSSGLSISVSDVLIPQEKIAFFQALLIRWVI